MVRAPYIDKNGLKKGAWSKEEDDKLKAYIQRYGHWNWRQLPKFAGLQRCGKSCRIRWLNYLRPDIKRGGYSKAEDDLIVELHEKLGSKWAKIAEQLPGRTDNEIKNHWHAHLKKCEKQNHGTPNQDLEETAIESSQFGVDIPNVIEGEAEKTTTLVNPSHPVILESSPFSPTTSSTESSSDSTHVNVLFDGDELDQKSSLWSEEEDDKLRACIQRYGLSSGRTEWDEPPCEISKSITEASDSIEQPRTEFPNLLTVSTTPADPMLDGFPLTPETTSSSTEFSFFSSDLNMAEDTMTQMEWFVEESSNPFETFESDFWTEPYVLDTAGTKSCSYPSCLVDWQWAYE